MKHYLKQDIYCPNCKTRINGAMNIGKEDEPPENGDVTFCIHCYSFLTYVGSEGNFIMSALNEDDILKLKEDEPEVFHQLMDAFFDFVG